MVRIGFDATALHGARTGIGVFTEQLLARIGAVDDFDVRAFAVTFRGRGQLADLLPNSVRPVGRPMAARPLRRCWVRSELPPIEWFIGSVDLVHGPNFVVPPASRAARLLTIHDIGPWRFPELANDDTRAYPGLVRRAIEHGAWVHTVSEHVAGEVRELFPWVADRVVVVANGVTDLGVESPATDADRGATLAGGGRYVLAIGTAEPRKDLPGLVEAFDEVARDDAELRLVLVGPDGWGTDALTSAIARARAGKRIARLGWVSDDDRVALLRGATAFCYPSLYEGFGLPPLEAMLAGTPVIATRAGALTEVLGDAADFVDPGEPAELAEAIRRLLGDQDHRSELITAGWQRAAGYSWDRCADGIAGLYRTMLAAR